MIIETYSHCNGYNVVNSTVRDELLGLLKLTIFEIKSGCARDLRKAILPKLKLLGWSDDFIVDVNSQISLTSCNHEHILCFQTGNMSRFYADLLKIQYVYKLGKAKAAIYIIPSKKAARVMNSNTANFERFVFEINLFKDIITIPTLVVGIN